MQIFGFRKLKYLDTASNGVGNTVFGSTLTSMDSQEVKMAGIILEDVRTLFIRDLLP